VEERMTTPQSKDAMEVNRPEAAEVKGLAWESIANGFDKHPRAGKPTSNCAFRVLPWYPRWLEVDDMSLEMMKV